jgi:hypothetical protein
MKTIINLSLNMSKEAGLIIGSVIFLVLGIIAAIAFHIYVGMKSPTATKAANQRYFASYAQSIIGIGNYCRSKHVDHVGLHIHASNESINSTHFNG